MSPERISEVREMLFNLERKIKPLEWDHSRKQINEFKMKTLESLKIEHQALTQELNGLENQ
jgi:hypothetical protein